MPSETHTTHGRNRTSRAVRHHPVVVVACLAIGALLGVLYAASLPATYTTTATVLVNPSVGNPFVPTPSSVRQDELTSLETEAQVARSAEVLGTVLGEYPTLQASALSHNLQIVVPPNSQTLAISYSAKDPVKAQLIANAVADAYLANRTHRFSDVNDAQIQRLVTQSTQVRNNLQRASRAAQSGSPGHRAYETQLASALRNQYNSLQAQRTVLENSDVPAGSVISPAVRPHAGTNLMALVAPIGGALAGLSLGCLIALLMEGLAGSVRAPWEVEELGLPVAAAVPTSRMPRLLRRHDPEAFAIAIRRLRALILDLDPRPDVISVAPPGDGRSEADVSEAVAESFAKAGHRVVLVRADDRSDDSDGLVVEDGLAQALLYERLNVMELLESSREPLLCVLPAGRSNAQSREFLTSERLRSVLAPLVEAGNTVVIESPGLGTVEGDAVTGASDLCLVAVTTRRTRTAAVAAFVQEIAAKGTPVAALVVGRHDAARRDRLGPADEGSGSKPQETKASTTQTRQRPARSKR